MVVCQWWLLVVVCSLIRASACCFRLGVFPISLFSAAMAFYTLSTGVAISSTGVGVFPIYLFSAAMAFSTLSTRAAISSTGLCLLGAGWSGCTLPLLASYMVCILDFQLLSHVVVESCT